MSLQYEVTHAPRFSVDQGFARRKLYWGQDITNLSTTGTSAGEMNAAQPFLSPGKSGALKFTYGTRIVYAGVGLDEAEGRSIIGILKARLPLTAVA